MPTYKIITDSSSDFTQEDLDRLNLASAPLTVTYNGESYDNFSDEAAIKSFYDQLRAGVMATTSAVNPQLWQTVMEPALEQGQDLLVLAFSSGLSTTYQSAVIAAQELGEKYPQRTIRVVDTLCAALGQGLLVWYACKKRDEGLSLEETAAWVEENKLHLCHWFTVDDLSHLKRGGRISATTALVGTMLNIKPVLHMDNDGKLANVAKVRGRKASIEYIAAKLGELGGDYENETVFVVHGDCLADAQTLANLVKKSCGVKNVHIGSLGPVIGAHSGPGTLSLFFMGSHR